MQPAYDLYITMKGTALKLLQSRGRLNVVIRPKLTTKRIKRLKLNYTQMYYCLNVYNPKRYHVNVTKIAVINNCLLIVRFRQIGPICVIQIDQRVM